MSSLQDNSASGSSDGEVNPIVGTITSMEEVMFWELYTPVEKLGSGAFGSVVAAIRIEDELPVAVKTMMRSTVAYVVDDNGESVPKEFHTLSLVAEVEGAIKVLGWFETEDKVFLVMEFPPDSINMAEYLSTYGFLPEVDVRDMVRQLVSTVIQMKEVNVLHRDLKLENILVEKETGNLKIIDFGLTSRFSSLQQTNRTCMGTSHYHAPEMVEKKKFIAGPGMVWAVGVIGFAFLTGKLPFKNGQKKNSKSLKYPSQISEVCRDFFKQCFIQDPEDRLSLDKLVDHPWLAASPYSEAELSPLLVTSNLS